MPESLIESNLGKSCILNLDLNRVVFLVSSLNTTSDNLIEEGGVPTPSMSSKLFQTVVIIAMVMDCACRAPRR